MPRGNRDDNMPDNWDPMREEFEGNASEGLRYDTLYVTNIPPKLNIEGVDNAFKPYNPLKKTYLSGDPGRRFAMLSFADPRDAERAIHGLHQKPPLSLRVEYAKKKRNSSSRNKDDGSGRQWYDSAPVRDAKPAQSSAVDDGRRRELGDTGSVSSGGRRLNGARAGRQDWVANNSVTNRNEEDIEEYYSEDERYVYDDLDLMADEEEAALEASAGVGVQRLLAELAEAKVQLVQAQMREKASQLGINAAVGRKSLPAGLSKGCFMTANGRIIRQVSAVANSGPSLLTRELMDRQMNFEDFEEDDIEQVPELRAHVCVRCGRRGELECGVCGTTYCSALCQRKDWMARHAAVCHNVASSSANLGGAGARVGLQQPRHPRKPTAVSPEIPRESSNNANREHTATGHHRQETRRFANNKTQGNKQRVDNDDKPQQPRQNAYNRRSDNYGKAFGGATFKKQQQRDDNADFSANNSELHSNLTPAPIRRPREQSVKNNRDADGSRSARPADSTNGIGTNEKEVAMPSPAATRKPRLEMAKEYVQPVTRTPKDDSPRPDGFVALHATPGMVLTLSVEAEGAVCDVAASYGKAVVCVAVAERFVAQFEELCGDGFGAACEKSEACRPLPGLYVALRDALDGGWYRARCLTETRAALVDAARIADVAHGDAGAVRRLPEHFSRAPEFSCVAGIVGLKVGESYQCVVSNVSSDGVCSGTVHNLVHNGGEELGAVTLRRWRCGVEDDLLRHDGQADSTNAIDTKAKVVATPSAPAASKPRPEMAKENAQPVTKTPSAPAASKPRPEMAKENAQPVTKTAKDDPLRPDGFVALHASPGTVLTLSVEAEGAACDVAASHGQAVVCVAVAEQFAVQFKALCGDEFVAACEKSEACRPRPGSYVVLRDALDGAWYRARCLTETRAALVDAARIADVTRADPGAVRRAPEGFMRAPEFCCVVGSGADVGLKVGESYKCVVRNVSSDGVCSGTLRNLVCADGEELGPVTLRRWRCRAEDEMEKSVLAGVPFQDVTQASNNETPAKQTVTRAKENSTQVKETVAPAVSIDAILERPAVANESKVLLVEYANSSRVFVRRADAESRLEFDSLVQDVAVYGLDAPPLAEPKAVGEVVIAQFTDGNYYRAIITKRSRVEQSKFMLEYIEYGNTEISNLDKLRPCPDELSLRARPALLSRVSLTNVASDNVGKDSDEKPVKFTEECIKYLAKLKDEEAELVLTLKDESSKGVLGCEVSLSVERSKERVNETLRRMLMPQWQVMESKGEDVVELPALMWSDMQIARLPEGPCSLQVLDAATLLAGAFSACCAGEDWRSGVMGLSEELEKYTGSKVGGASYLPRQNELCVAKSEDGKWYRAACVEHPGGAGASQITVLYIDSGRVESVAVSDVRKMLPETAKRMPALAAYCTIDGYPDEPSNELIVRTRELLGVTDASTVGGVVDCSEAKPTSAGEYSVALPTVFAALAADGLLQ